MYGIFLTQRIITISLAAKLTASAVLVLIRGWTIPTSRRTKNTLVSNHLFSARVAQYTISFTR